MALSDDSKQDDEMNVGAFVGDPDTLSYQPIRDLNVDVEKLLEHLPSKTVLLLVVFTLNCSDRGLEQTVLTQIRLLLTLHWNAAIINVVGCYKLMTIISGYIDIS